MSNDSSVYGEGGGRQMQASEEKIKGGQRRDGSPQFPFVFSSLGRLFSFSLLFKQPRAWNRLEEHLHTYCVSLHKV